MRSRSTVSSSLAATNGLLPASISYSTTPQFQMSVRWSTSCPRSCSPTILRTPNTSATTFQTGDPSHLLGGVREFFYQISTNTYRQPSEFDIVANGANSGALVVTNGV